MVRVFLTNFGWFLQSSYATLDAAIQAAKRGGFECSFHRDSKILGSWSILGGFRVI